MVTGVLQGSGGRGGGGGAGGRHPAARAASRAGPPRPPCSCPAACCIARHCRLQACAINLHPSSRALSRLVPCLIVPVELGGRGFPLASPEFDPSWRPLGTPPPPSTGLDIEDWHRGMELPALDASQASSAPTDQAEPWAAGPGGPGPHAAGAAAIARAEQQQARAGPGGGAGGGEGAQVAGGRGRAEGLGSQQQLTPLREPSTRRRLADWSDADESDAEAPPASQPGSGSQRSSRRRGGSQASADAPTVDLTQDSDDEAAAGRPSADAPTVDLTQGSDDEAGAGRPLKRLRRRDGGA